MSSWITNLFKSKKNTHDEDVKAYRFVAMCLGTALATPYGRENSMIGFNGQGYRLDDPELYHLLNEYEITYARLGYRVVPLQVWIDEGWDAPIDDYWLIKREPGERPMYTKFTDVPEIPKRNPLFGENC